MGAFGTGFGIFRDATTGGGDITGSGTAPKIPNFTAASVIGDSQMSDNGTTVFVGASATSASALFEINSTTQGFLAPRMTEAERDLIGTPATGLFVYNTDDDEFNYYNGTSWIVMGNGIYSGSGALVGDTTVTMADNFLNFTTSDSVRVNFAAASPFSFGYSGELMVLGTGNEEYGFVQTDGTHTLATYIGDKGGGGGQAGWLGTETDTSFALYTLQGGSYNNFLCLADDPTASDSFAGFHTSSPTASVDIGGAGTLRVRSLGVGTVVSDATGNLSVAGRTAVTTATYNVLVTDTLLGVTRTATGTSAINLPLASAYPAGIPLVIKDEGDNAATNNITITPQVGDTIDTAANQIINADLDSLTIYSDGGTAWFIM